MVRIERIKQNQLNSILPFWRALNEDIATETLEQRLQEMLLQGYQCIGVFDGDRLIGISGLWILTKYYVGKHIEPDNVYILPEYQGKGIGRLLMAWIFDYAKSLGCVASELNCYIKNEAGQRFWKEQGYEVVAYHYQKQLS